jgi:RHS repeat-associated protein
MSAPEIDNQNGLRMKSYRTCSCFSRPWNTLQEYSRSLLCGALFAQEDIRNILSGLFLFILVGISFPACAQSGAVVFGFAGEGSDSTGLINLRARDYDPETGTFLSKDPLGVASTLNGYQYCNGDPIDLTDPTGLFRAGMFFGGLAGFVANGSIAVGGALLAETGIGAAAGVYGAYQAGGNIGNMINAFRSDDLPEGPTGPIQATAQITMLTATDVSPSSLTWENVDFAGKLGDTAVQTILSGQIDSRLITTPVGAPGTLAGTLTEVYVPLEEQQTLPGLLVNGGTYADIGFTAYQGGTVIGSDILALASQQSGTSSSQQSTSTDGNADSSAFSGNPSNPYSSVFSDDSSFDLPVGGVLLNEAATLVGQNLSDITGGMYDPVSGQFVMLGTNNPTPVKNINLDYLYTALQAVYGSAQPPFVTLNPSASAYTQWINLNGGSVFQTNEWGGFTLLYDPIWPNVDTSVDVVLFANQNGTPYQWRARFKCESDNIFAGGRQAMQMVFSNWVTDTYATLPPSGITLYTNSWEAGVFDGTSLSLSASGQESYTGFYLYNGTANNYTINGVMVVPAVQQREFGGRVENTKVGWVMEEADRVMKCLSVGTDNLTGASYSNATTSPALNTIPGYSNMVQRLSGTSQSVNVRFWFTPDQMTLQQYIDPTSGLASIVFTNATVSLNTEAFMLGLPQSPQALAFANNFTTNYDKFAALQFPCHDPNDPAGTNIIQTNIFGMLRDVMKAVSLARFFRDNDVPVDMWWLNSWQEPTAYTPKSVPTAANVTGAGGILCYGGVQDYLPNTYIPSTTASNVASVVQSSRPDMTGNPNGDIQQQVWTNSTTVGTLTAVAAHTAAEPQDGNVNLAEKDLSFASPGAMKLSFSRYYQSSWLGVDAFGPGWRYTPFVLEFERPSWYDQTHLMVDAETNPLPTLADGDTGLRSGAIRLVNLSSGATLDFESSLVLGSGINNLGNVVITVAGLATNDVPTFTPGLRQIGAGLTQLSSNLNYLCTTPDGQSLTFDHDGHLLQASDRYGRVKNYLYDSAEHLTNITDDAGQALTFDWDSTTNYIMSVTGPASEEVVYTYTNGCLATATHVRSGATVSYTYNTNNQLIAKTRFNGLGAVLTQPDLKGRAGTNYDYRGNSLRRAFTQDSAGQVRTSQITDPLVTGTNFVPEQRQFDRSGRMLAWRNTTGAQTGYGYNSNSLLPNTVTLPITGRPPINIQRDAYGRPIDISDPGNIGAYDLTAVYDTNTTQLQQITDEAGRATGLYYNTNHNLNHIRRTHYGTSGAQTVDVGMNYTGSGALYQITDPLSNTVVTIQRDSLDRATNVTDATGVSDGAQYDSLGRLSQLHDPRLSSPVVYHYDNFDRVTEVDYPSGTNYFTYDPVKGWLTSRTDMLGRTTRYDRDPNTGDVLQTVQLVPGGANLTTVMSYDRFGNLASITPPQSSTITYNYDPIGRQVGNAYSGVSIPNAPSGLVCNHATNGMPTTYSNLTFSWQPPVSSAGLNGYSYGFDQMPGSVTNTVGTNAVINNVNPGSHLFQVKAQDTNGMWGPTADFQFVVWAPGTEPPGAPPGLICNVTANGVPTYTATNIIFSWQAPGSENGIAGYSYAFNGTPTNGISTTTTTATFGSVPVGANTFEVMAGGNNGVWGPISSFQLNVLEPPASPDLSITLAGSNSVIVSWWNTGSYTLHQNSNLAGGTWVTSSYTVTTSNGTNSVTITPATGSQFFRLSSP